jgi:hypothetical protein
MKLIFPILIAAIFLITMTLSPAKSASIDSVKILVADDPHQCIQLEGIFLDGDNYLIIDGKNNMGIVKYMKPDGTITATGVPALPLPDAASLPLELSASPFGLDRVLADDKFIYVIPAPWARTSAEMFTRNEGTFIRRLADLGAETQGLVTGPSGKTWAVAGSSIVDISSDDGDHLNLSSFAPRIDTVSGSPLGFLVYSSPNLTLIEPSGFNRWTVGLDGITDNFLSPMDIACGSDGTIAILAQSCTFDDPSIRQDYDKIRTEAISEGNEQAIFSLEESLRSNFGTGYVLVLLRADGTVTDIVDLNTPTVACAVDPSGRVHLLSYISDPNGSAWDLTIIDPKLNKALPQCKIPEGSPVLISPHRFTSGPDGSFYWDDVVPEGNNLNWGINRLSPASSSPFALTSTQKISQIFNQKFTGTLGLATSLAVGASGEKWVGMQEYPLNLDSGKPPEDNKVLLTCTILHLGSDGVLIDKYSPPPDFSEWSVPSELVPLPDTLVTAWAMPEVTTSPLVSLSEDGTWGALKAAIKLKAISTVRIGQTAKGYLGWFSVPNSSGEFEESRWFSFDSQFNGAMPIERLSASGSRILGSDPINKELYVTIDDGEIFSLNAETLLINGIWTNRFPSGSQIYSLNEGLCTPDGLAILDRQHRSIFRLTRDKFIHPQSANEIDVMTSIAAIQKALAAVKNSTGSYPIWWPNLLEQLLDSSGFDLMQQAFIGGRIYNYRPTKVGYTFTVWSAALDQPILICSPTDVRTIK